MPFLISQELLASLAEFCGGSVTVCDQHGKVIETFPCQEMDQSYSHIISSVIAEAVSTEETVNMATKNELSLITVKLNKILLVLDNRKRIEDKVNYQQIIEDSLPFIAQVAGGTAVLFDKQGTRIRAIQPDGKQDKEAEGAFTFLSQRVMKELRPSIGPSTLYSGATAVRIPLTSEYGVAFNNLYAVKQRQRLLDNARQKRYANYHIEDIIGESKSITRAKRMAVEVAKSQSTVLIYGETGTGKELFAQAIHNLSSRHKQLFVAINCEHYHQS